jgi:hypothetical protein
MLSPVPGLGDGHGGALAVPAVISAVRPVATVMSVTVEPPVARPTATLVASAQTATRRVTVVVDATDITPSGRLPELAFRVGTIIDTFA